MSGARKTCVFVKMCHTKDPQIRHILGDLYETFVPICGCTVHFGPNFLHATLVAPEVQDREIKIRWFGTLNSGICITHMYSLQKLNFRGVYGSSDFIFLSAVFVGLNTVWRDRFRVYTTKRPTTRRPSTTTGASKRARAMCC